MRRIFYGLAMAGLSLTFVPLQAQQPDKQKTEQTDEKAESEALMNRLKEIEKMDKSDLSAEEKKTLKKEVRSIEKRLHILNGGLIALVGLAVIVTLILIMF